jgi:hypothetical protein
MIKLGQGLASLRFGAEQGLQILWSPPPIATYRQTCMFVDEPRGRENSRRDLL